MTRKRAAEQPLATQLWHRRFLIIGLLLAAASIYIVVPQLSFFAASWDKLRASNPWLLLVAVGCLLVSYLAATVVYKALSPRHLPTVTTYGVQLASSFAGRVLPAGVGSLGVNYLYLRRRGIVSGSAATLVATNNLLGFVGHMVWVVFALVWAPRDMLSQAASRLPSVWLVLVGAGVVLLAITAWYTFRHRIMRFTRGMQQQLAYFRRRPQRLVLGLVASMVLTACNITIVWLAARALAVPIDFTAAVLVLTVGVAAQSATPTPGGLGGAEAGLAAGLAVVGVPLSSAVAVALLFRLITFWLPLLLGGLAMIFVLRRRLI